MPARRPLTREKILETALRLADESGIEALSMRKLARELGVEAMSLYNHVANKRDLVDAMVEQVLAEIELPADGEWDAAIRTCAVSAHEAFVRHPWACSLVISGGAPHSVDTPRLRYMEWLLGRLRDAGFSAELTYHAYHTLDSHIIGFTLWQLGHSVGIQEISAEERFDEFLERFLRELRAHDYRHLVEHAEQHMQAAPGDGPRQFAFGLDLILEGLERARTAEAGGASRVRVTRDGREN